MESNMWDRCKRSWELPLYAELMQGLVCFILVLCTYPVSYFIHLFFSFYPKFSDCIPNISENGEFYENLWGVNKNYQLDSSMIFMYIHTDMMDF